MRIRTADPHDHEPLRQLNNEAYLVEQFFVGGDRLSEAEMADLVRRGTLLVGEDDAGALRAGVYVETDGDRGYFGPLAVDPAVKGAGWGRRMVEAAEAHARGCGCAAMDLTIASPRAELPPFYRALGYVESGTRPFTDPRKLRECHFVVMTKSLGR